MLLARSLPLLAFLATAASAQQAIVATRGAATPATVLLVVNLQNGSFAPLPRFPSDVLAPRALTVDVVNRDVVLALDNGATSRLVRVHRSGALITGERVLADVSGAVTAIALGIDGDLFVTTGGNAGALLRVARNGGTPFQLASLPRATAMLSWGHQSSHAFIAQSGAAGADPSLRVVDLSNGSTTSGPYVYTGYTPLGITGLFDLPTGVPRQVVSHDDGTVALSVAFSNPTPIPLTPVLPAGATRALRGIGLEGIALGGQAHPYLKSFSAFPPGTQWAIRAGPLPGDPVDFEFDVEVGAGVVMFGRSCSSLGIGQGPGGDPRIGNPNFGLGLTGGQALQPVFLLFGGSDQRWVGVPLPAALPGACSLLVAADVALPQRTDGNGFALQRLPVPPDPALHGLIAFAQWLQARGTALDLSQGAAIHLAR
jgi:hypothetical protein